MNALTKYIFTIIIGFCTSNFVAQFYTGSDIEFGQNRVQYNNFFWQYHHYQNFKVFYYTDGIINAEYVAKRAEKFKDELEVLMDFAVKEELEFIVYNSYSDFKQSNVGLRNDGSSNIGGVTNVIGEKIFVYYEDDHESFDRQIRGGIAKVYAFKLMYGENWREALKNTSLLSLPNWYLEGFISFMEGDWNTDLDNQVKTLLMRDDFKSINHLNREESKLVGHAIWNYISDTYGTKMIPNVLYMTRLSRNIESGFLYVLGASLPGLTSNFLGYYRGRYNEDIKDRSAPDENNELTFRKKSKYHYFNYHLSPDGKYATFVTNELGQYKLWLYDLEKDKKKCIKKRGWKLDRPIDYSQPVMAWHPSSKVLTYIDEHKGVLMLNIYDVDEKKTTPKPIGGLSKVLSMNYNSDGKKIAMSAVENGKTDVFIYNLIGGSKKRMTNDIFDDLEPSFIENDTKIIFSSNRIDDTIRKKVEIKAYKRDYDLFVLDIDKPKKPLQRITNTPFASERKPYEVSKNNYVFISNENGINNRHIAYYDSAIAYIDTAVHYRYFSATNQLTNFPYGIKEYRQNKNGEYAMLIEDPNGFHFYQGNTKDDVALEGGVKYTQFMKEVKRENNSPIPTFNSKPKTSNKKVDIENYQFIDDVPETPKEVPVVVKLEKDTALPIEFELPRAKIYKLNFSNDFVVSQFDNSFLNQTYQRLSGQGFNNPGFNGIMKLGLIDVFEDYRIIGGFRYPVNFRNTEYLLSFENIKNRLDKKYLLTRRSYQELNGSFISKIQTYEAKHSLKFPFSEVSSLRFTLGARLDRNISLSTEPLSLLTPDVDTWLGTAKLSYVFDATRNIDINIMNGLRFKAWAEFMNELVKGQTDFLVLGMDLRHYQKIHRNIVFASRLAASTSLGSQRLVYFMGGVDQWIGARFDPSVQISPNENFQFQTIATPMRGFFQNTRNGNSFAVINNEIRFPVFKYFSKTPLKSDFFNHFMMIGFGDIGTAWTGKNPYDLENSFNTTIVSGPNYEVIIENQKEPVIYGYGGGLRTKLLGYYVRWDIAWGVDDGVILRPVNYFSLSLDF